MPKLNHPLQIDPFDINCVVVVDISKCTGEPAGHWISKQKIVSSEDFNNSYLGHDMVEMFEVLEKKMTEPILLSASSMETINEGSYRSDTSEEFLGFSK